MLARKSRFNIDLDDSVVSLFSCQNCKIKSTCSTNYLLAYDPQQPKRVIHPVTKLVCENCYNKLINCNHADRLIVEKPVKKPGNVLLVDKQNISICRSCLSNYLQEHQVDEILNQF